MGSLKRTIKEQEFIRAYIDCKGNATKAYHQVFPHVSLESARRLASLLLSKLDIPITELLDLIGVDDHILTQKLNEGLTATRLTGKEGHKKKVPNYTVNQRYLDMILRLKAKYPVDQSRLVLPGTGVATVVILREVVYNKEGKPVKEPIKEQKDEKAPF